jgi:hypothetical protein
MNEDFPLKHNGNYVYHVPGSVSVGFMVKKLALALLSIRYSRVSPVNIIPPRIFRYRLGCEL